MTEASSDPTRTESLAADLLESYYHGWRDVFSRQPHYWFTQACHRILALAGDDEVIFIDGVPWSKDHPEVAGRIVAFTDRLLIQATVTEGESYAKSGISVRAINRSRLESVGVGEIGQFDNAEWPDFVNITATYTDKGVADVTFPLGDQPTENKYFPKLYTFVQSLMEDLRGR